MGGKLSDMPRVLRTTRLLPYCLKIGGWSHTCGNIMRDVVTTTQRWPVYLTWLRALCRFLKKRHYRRHFKRWILQIHGVDPGTDLDHFSADFAKWRFETVHTVLFAIVKIRQFLNYWTPHAWNNMQDHETFNEVKEALEDDIFYRGARGRSRMSLNLLRGCDVGGSCVVVKRMYNRGTSIPTYASGASTTPDESMRRPSIFPTRYETFRTRIVCSCPPMLKINRDSR